MQFRFEPFNCAATGNSDWILCCKHSKTCRSSLWQCQSFLANLFHYFLYFHSRQLPKRRGNNDNSSSSNSSKTNLKKYKKEPKTCFPVTFIFNQVASLYAQQTADRAGEQASLRERMKLIQ